MTPVERVFPGFRALGIQPGGGVLRNVAGTAIGRASMDHPGAYTLRFDGSALSAQAADDDGERSARAALRQLAADEGSECPCFEATDWPQFATRGFMLDVSRNRVPTMETLRELVEVLSTLRMNHLQLYTEHAFAYRGHETVWRDASPITPDEIRELDSLCSERGITLAANQNCFGHLAEWLRHPAYADLAETQGPYDFYGLTRDGPFSLCPTDERSLALVGDWIGQLSECFSSRLLNIGCDETADVGTGRSKSKVEARGRAAVYADYVQRVARIAAEHGFEPMFWADIALASPETFGMLPGSLRPLAWGYEPEAPFEAWDAALRDAGRTGWVCPGTSCWRSFAGRTSERKGNLRAAGAARGSFDGMLVTAWGDVGHQQQWATTLHALADAAHTAWHGEPATDSAAGSRLIFRAADVGPWLDELGDADYGIRSASGDAGASAVPAPLRNASALFNELYPANPGLPPRGSLEQWRDCADRLRGLGSSIPAAEGHFADELRWTVQMSMLACRVAILRRSEQPDPALRADLSNAGDAYRRLWGARSRPGGLDRSIEHLCRLGSSLEGARP